MTQTKIYHLLGLEEPYSENDYTTQSNLQIQCNPYQTTMVFSTNNFTIFMETQKTPNSKIILRKKWSWRDQAPYTTKLQSSSQCGTGTKKEKDQWSRLESSAIKPHTYGHLICNKGGKNRRMKKRQSQ